MKRNLLAAISIVVVVSFLFGAGALAKTDGTVTLRLHSQQDEVTPEDTVEPPGDPTDEVPTATPVPPTTTGDHPVMSAIATFFDVPYTEIEALHDQGLGMGVIASVYLMADAMEMTPEEIIAAKDDGQWGQLLKDLKEEMKSGKLGSIMSGRRVRETDEPEPGVTPPGDDEQERQRQRDRQQDKDQSHEQPGSSNNGNGNGSGQGTGGGDNGKAGQGDNGGGGGKGGGGKGK